MIESVIVILLICLIFAAVLQVSQLFAAREVLFHAAACGARAKTVGLNYWMVEKSIRVAAIPNSGHLITPDFENVDLGLRDAVANSRPGGLWDAVLSGSLRPGSAQCDLEKARIPEYLGSENEARSRFILDYECWHESPNDISYTASADSTRLFPTIRVHVRQDYPLRVPCHRAFYAAESVRLRGESELENHYALYLDDMEW